MIHEELRKYNLCSVIIINQPSEERTRRSIIKGKSYVNQVEI